jgi:hypothetical protein
MTHPMPLPNRLAGEHHFRWRGGAVSRLEGLSDSAFALAMGLLVLASGDSISWDGLRRVLHSIPVLVYCFAMLLWLWNCHFYFHRRYGLEHGLPIFLNVLFIFLVLVYMVPTRYIAMLLLDKWLQLDLGYSDRWPDYGQWRILITFYSGWFAALFGVLHLMYAHAWRHRDVLELNQAERARTLGVKRAHLLTAGIGLSSVALVWTAGGDLGLYLSGGIYALTGPVNLWTGIRTDRAVQRAVAAEV